MAPEILDQIISDLLTATRTTLEHAAAVLRAAEVCIEGDRLEKGIEIANDADDLTHEAGEFLAAMTLLKRRFKSPRAEQPDA